MRKLVLLALATAAFAPAAHAAPFLTITGPSGVFGDDNVSGQFTRSFTFDRPGFRLASLDISSIAADGATDVDFTSVTFNGVEFDIVSTGRQELRNLFDQPLRAGDNTIVVRGFSGRDGAFSGTLSLAAIPEPATWAMMIGGFGMVGAAARRRTRVNVAFA